MRAIKYYDYLAASCTGLITALFLFLSFWLVGTKSAMWLALFVVLPLLWLLGVKAGEWLSRYVAVFFLKFSKYIAVGFSSASIDFAVLNIISFFTGVSAGVGIGYINAPGFILATINGYFWNKWWVFNSNERFFSSFPKFLFITSIGLVLNSAIVIFLTTYFFTSGLTNFARLNMAKIIATGCVILWNFSGYKYFVFKKIGKHTDMGVDLS